MLWKFSTALALTNLPAAALCAVVAPRGSRIHLTAEHPSWTEDYEITVTGFPRFEVESFAGPVQVEVKYSDTIAALTNPDSDGPFLFSSSLTNNFRIETFEITSTGIVESFFMQGGLRYHSVRLIRGEFVSLSAISIRPVAQEVPISSLPGSFHCSKDLYNRIWNLGSHAVQQTCVEAGTQPSTWEPSQTNGVLIRGQRAARSARVGAKLPNPYNLTFETKIERGGTGWAVDANPVPGGGAIWTLNPFLRRFYMSQDVEENQWITVTTVSTAYQLYSVYINSILVLDNLNTTAFNIPAFSSTEGNATVGFAPWRDEAAFYRNVEIRSGNGSLTYFNSMMAPDVAEEFGVASNAFSVCLDGAKRDRMVWTGDLHFTARTIAVTTANWDLIRSNFDFAFDFQLRNGGVAVAGQLGARPEDAAVWSAPMSTFLMDYHLDFIDAIYEYYILTGDIGFVSRRWTQIKALFGFVQIYINPTTLLLDAYTFKGSANGTAPTCMVVQSLRSLASLADAVGDFLAAGTYRDQATRTTLSIQNLLFRSSTGAFSTSLASSNFSYIDYAMSILSRVATPSQIKSQLPHLDSLKEDLGFRDSTSNAFTGEFVALSPYLSGYLLESLLRTGNEDKSRFLLDGVFGSMAAQTENYTGASWEYVSYEGGPGIGLFTSLTHPWGSGATSALTYHVLGVTFRLGAFEVRPTILDLIWAEGTLPTPRGMIEVRWEHNPQTGKFNLKYVEWTEYNSGRGRT
ncbi:hypothetical protein P7C70_g5430, partial [Phenoliferia sp. Uapishka_3]